MPETIVENIGNKIKPIAQQFNLSSVWLFGSYANQKYKNNSDIDIIVKTEDVAEGFKLIEVKFAFEEVLKKKVDIITTGSIKGSLLEDENLNELLIYKSSEE